MTENVAVVLPLSVIQSKSCLAAAYVRSRTAHLIWICKPKLLLDVPCSSSHDDLRHISGTSCVIRMSAESKPWPCEECHRNTVTKSLTIVDLDCQQLIKYNLDLYRNTKELQVN